MAKRARGNEPTRRNPYMPPEDWHEPHGQGGDYRIIIKSPGHGLRHVLTPDDVRQRLADLPAHFSRDLEVVQFSSMTRKKSSFPCYGMQWGAAIYLYPIEESLVERFVAPPKPMQYNEGRMYGGQWGRDGQFWTLTWTEEGIRDFYLNNILIHELGHLVDNRNTRHDERERYAEWFAVHYGYLPTQAKRLARLGRRSHVQRHG